MNDGICYLELRTTPRSTPHLTAAQYIATLVDTISSFEHENPQLHTRLILSIDRRHTLEQAKTTLGLGLKYRNQGVVGLDLCGDPTARPNGEISVFTPVFQEAKREGLEITVHFAEAEASGSKEELSTLLSWEPGRLGHVIWEDEETKKEIARRELCLELCLSCNVKADMVLGGFEGHHFGHWRGVKGPKISLGVSFRRHNLSTTEVSRSTNNDNRLTTLVYLEAHCLMSIDSLHSTLALIVKLYVAWQDNPLMAFLEVNRRKKGCGASCGHSEARLGSPAEEERDKSHSYSSHRSIVWRS